MAHNSTDDEEFRDPDPGSSLPLYLGIRALLLAFLLAGLYLTRPLWHGLVYAMLFSPEGAVLIGGGVILALTLWFLPRERLPGGDGAGALMRIFFEQSGGRDPDDIPEEIPTDLPDEPRDQTPSKFQLFAVALGVLFVLSILVGVPGGALEQRTLAEQTMDDAVEVDAFPQANPDNPRVMPREVSDITTRGAVSYRQHRLGASDIARQENGNLAWSYPIQPDGFRNRVMEYQRGVMMADMTSMDDRQRVAYEEDFQYGEGMFLHRSADWNLKLTDYFARYDDDPVEFSQDGSPYMYYPKTVHEWHLTPFPHTTPAWGGGALVHPDGTIEHLSPDEAQDHDILDGQRLYPLTLSRAEMNSLGYREGIINQMEVIGAHEGQIEMAGLPAGADNEQPFVIDLAGEELSYVTAMEPYGADTRGLDEVWFADASTGAYQYFGTEEETLTGPERAMGIARSADSRTNWGENFVVAEPVPVTSDGDLWWHIKVAPVDYTDVTRNVFVNADTGAAIEIHEDDAIRDFIRGDLDEEDMAPADETEVEPAPDEPDVAYYILITDEDGNVIERIPIEPGQDVTIVDPTDDRVSTTGTAP